MIAVLALAISIWAALTANKGQTNAGKREEFHAYRERLDRVTVDLDAQLADLARLTDGTVPFGAVAAGFDSAYAAVDTIILTAEDALQDTDSCELFGTGWRSCIEDSVETWRAEYDLTMSEVRPTLEREEASTRAVAALRVVSKTIKAKVRENVKALL